MADLDIKVALLRSLGNSQGVISEPALLNETNADLWRGLKYQGVTAVRCFTIVWDNKEIPTKHLVLTFYDSTPSEHIKKLWLHPLLSGHTFQTCAAVPAVGHGTNT